MSASAMRFGAFAFAAFWLLLASSPRADEGPALPHFDAWQLTESEAMGFRVRLPPSAIRTDNVRSTWVGEVREVAFDADFSGSGLAVQVRELPPGTRWFVTPNYILEQVKDGILDGGKRTPISEADVERDGHAGRRIRYADPERPGWVEEAVYFLVENRLYLLFAACDEAASVSLPIEQFFASFEIR